MSDRRIEIRWDVKNVELLWKEKVSLISPTFSKKKFVHSHKFRLIITRIGETGEKEDSIEECEKATEKEYMSLYLQNLLIDQCSFWGPIFNVTFLVSHPLSGEILSQSKIHFDVCSKRLFGFEKFISKEKFKEYCLDKFTIICKFKKLEQNFKVHAQFFNQSTSSDVNLIVGLDEIQAFPVHKIVLALGSYYFRNKFAEEKSISSLKIENTRPEVAIEMLRYMYTGEATHLESIAYELFEAALCYEVHGLRFKCQKFLMRNLKLENVIRTLLACSGYFIYNGIWIEELLLKCMILIDQNLDEVVRLDLCKELLEKGPEILTEIVTHLSTTNFVKITCNKDQIPACSLTCNKRFKRFANSSDYSDIEINVDDSKFAAHKLILAARSPVFDRMFSHNMKETISGIVTIEDIRPQVFENLLRFIYTNEIECEDDLIQEILIAADKYEINDLKWKCENILEEKLTGDNVITTLIFAADHNAERLKKKCLRFITHAYSPFWSNSFNHFDIPKSILNKNLAKSHPHLLYEMLKEIH